MPNLKSINRGAAKGIGIDFTPDSAQTISLERKGGHLRIINVSAFPYEQDADGAATVFPSALKRHIKAEGVRLAGVSLTSLGSNETIHDIPNTLPDAALENFVQVQVRSIGSLSEDNLIYDYQVMRGLNPETRNILLSIAREESVTGCCDFLSGIKPLKKQKVTSHVLAVASAFCALHPDAAYLSTPQVILNLEEDSTVMAIVCNGSVVCTSLLLFGIHNIPHTTGLPLLREEYENAVSRWRETLPADVASTPLSNIWATGESENISQFVDMLGAIQPEASIQMFGVPGDMMPQQDTLLHTDLTVLFGLALFALDESPVKISLLPERQKWMEHKKHEYPYLALAFALLVIGLLAWFAGAFYHINTALKIADAEHETLKQCSVLIPQMEKMHERMAYQQKRMLPVAEAGYRTVRYMEALQRWQAAQATGDEAERCWGIYLADEFSFERANKERQEEAEAPARPQPIRSPSTYMDLFSEESKVQEQPAATYSPKTININTLKILSSIYIGGIAPLGKTRYKVVKDMQTQLVEAGVYVNVDDHTDFITKSFSDKYFTPWRTFLQANTDALGGEFTTFFMQLPFKEELIHSNHLTVPSTTKRY